MIRIAKQTDPKRLADLKKKIKNDGYISLAIDRIAITLTNEILSMKEE